MPIYSGVFSVAEKLAAAKLNALVFALNGHNHDGGNGGPQVSYTNLTDLSSVSNVASGPVQLSAANKLPAVDGSLLTGITASQISGLWTSGMIMMYKGTIATIPSGWFLCDGNNGTPDLRDKFVVGARQDSGGVAKSNLEGTLNQSGGSALQPPGFFYPSGPTSGPSGPSSPYAGSFQAVVPPYYALAFIMKA